MNYIIEYHNFTAHLLSKILLQFEDITVTKETFMVCNCLI